MALVSSHRGFTPPHFRGRACRSRLALMHEAVHGGSPIACEADGTLWMVRGCVWTTVRLICYAQVSIARGSRYAASESASAIVSYQQ